MEIKIQRIDKELPLPGYAKDDDAALDLRSAEEKTIQPMEHTVVKTGIKVAIPTDHVGLVWDRSGMAVKHGIHTMAGVIDAGYRGEIGIVLINLGKDAFTIEKSMRIAQLVIQPVLNMKVTEVDELEATARGEAGFGSTGTH